MVHKKLHLGFHFFLAIVMHWAEIFFLFWLFRNIPFTPIFLFWFIPVYYGLEYLPLLYFGKLSEKILQQQRICRLRRLLVDYKRNTTWLS